MAKLAARDFFNKDTSPKPGQTLNLFGASTGGPIVKDKTFFFLTYQGKFIRQASASTTTMPQAAWMTGDFSGVPGLSPTTLSTRLGRLRQTAVRRADTCPALPRALHAPCRDLKSSHRRRGPGPRHLPLEGLRARQSVTTDDAQRNRIPAAILFARAPAGLRPDPLLWVSCKSAPSRRSATLPSRPRVSSGSSPGNTDRRDDHGSGVVAMSAMWRDDDRDRTTERAPDLRPCAR